MIQRCETHRLYNAMPGNIDLPGGWKWACRRDSRTRARLLPRKITESRNSQQIVYLKVSVQMKSQFNAAHHGTTWTPTRSTTRRGSAASLKSIR